MKLLHIQHAGSTDADSLSRIAYISKKFWGYPNEWMDVWRPILTLDPESLTKHPAYVAHVNEQFIGFYQLALGGLAELKHLWVLPQWMGQEVGKQLFLHACGVGREHGLESFGIQADPNALGFYQKMGAVLVGYEDSSVLGHPRKLPILEMRL
jgi:GNAT superfamily N-acetyltransferase